MSYELTIEPIGQTIEVEEGQTILDAALRAGIWLPHACCHGLCATCKVQVLDGEIDHGEASSFALMDFERDEGKTLACCARLESDVTIEAEIEVVLQSRDHRLDDPVEIGLRPVAREDLLPRLPRFGLERGEHLAVDPVELFGRDPQFESPGNELLDASGRDRMLVRATIPAGQPLRLRRRPPQRRVRAGWRYQAWGGRTRRRNGKAQ